MVEIIIREFGGKCPVQGEGTIDGKEFYFRARGEWWTLGIGGDNVIMQPLWAYEEKYSDDMFGAGYMSYEEAGGFLFKAIRLYLEGHPSAVV